MIRNSGLIMLLVLVLAGCAAAQGPQLTLERQLAERDFRLGAEVERIHEFNLNGWNYLDRQHAILHVGASKRYLVSLRSPCHGLMSVEVIGFSTTTSYLTRFDKLLVKDRASSILEQCFIDELHELVKLERGVETA